MTTGPGPRTMQLETDQSSPWVNTTNIVFVMTAMTLQQGNCYGRVKTYAFRNTSNNIVIDHLPAVIHFNHDCLPLHIYSRSLLGISVSSPSY